MEATNTNEESSENEGIKRLVKPPNKKKYDDEITGIDDRLKILETHLKPLLSKPEDSALAELPELKRQKSATIDKRRKLEDDVRSLQAEISKKSCELNKVSSTLTYKHESKITETVRRLDQQLKMNNYKLSEENKIVQEIDRLNRSRRKLGQYNTLKQEVDSLRHRQKILREEKDVMFVQVKEIKTKEDEIRSNADTCRKKTDELRKEMDELFTQKRQIMGDYKTQEKEYQTFQHEMKWKKAQEYRKRKEEEELAKYAQLQQELAEYEASREPFEDEKQLINTLNKYLLRHHSSEDGSQQSQDSSKVNTHKEIEGMVVLKKKDEELFSGIVRQKQRKKGKDKRKSIVNKPIVHSPEVFSQFEKLELKAPSTASEVPLVIQKLEEKRLYYESFRQATCDLRAADLQRLETPGATCLGNSDEEGSTVAPSFISDSIQTTPEVQSDPQAPHFPLGSDFVRPRKLSRDSGTCDSEDPASCDDSDRSFSVTSAKFGYDSQNCGDGGFSVENTNSLNLPSCSSQSCKDDYRIYDMVGDTSSVSQERKQSQSSGETVLAESTGSTCSQQQSDQETQICDDSAQSNQTGSDVIVKGAGYSREASLISAPYIGDDQAVLTATGAGIPAASSSDSAEYVPSEQVEAVAEKLSLLLGEG